MQIKDVKDLQKVIELCRKEGVDKIKVDGIYIELGTAPIPTTKKQTTPQISVGITEDTKVDLPQELTPEQLLFYSVANAEEA